MFSKCPRKVTIRFFWGFRYQSIMGTLWPMLLNCKRLSQKTSNWKRFKILKINRFNSTLSRISAKQSGLNWRYRQQIYLLEFSTLRKESGGGLPIGFLSWLLE